MSLIRVCTFTAYVLLLGGCAANSYHSSSSPSQPAPNPMRVLGLGLDTKKAQEEFETEKGRIEAYARANIITWVEAARRVRELDRSFARRTDLDANWKFDYNDEEYHAFSIAAAALVDSGRVTFTEYDAARTKRFSEIVARQQTAAQASRQRVCVTTVSGVAPFQSLVTTCQ